MVLFVCSSLEDIVYFSAGPDLIPHIGLPVLSSSITGVTEDQSSVAFLRFWLEGNVG
ncbi:MAG TPA: hypothetical protein VK638_28560 [Edaphobacter sp.]|nr:hypothetical protein [Edaphobacter sp.]